jgi:hypothetical protein
VKNQGRIEKEKKGENKPERLLAFHQNFSLGDSNFPALSPEHRLNTPNTPDEEKARERDEGMIQRDSRGNEANTGGTRKQKDKKTTQRQNEKNRPERKEKERRIRDRNQ